MELFDDLATCVRILFLCADQSGLKPVDSLSQKCGNDITISNMERGFQSVTKQSAPQCAVLKKRRWLKKRVETDNNQNF